MSRSTRRVLVPMVATTVMGLLLAGLVVTWSASDLSAANAADAVAANEDFAPATGLDDRAALPPPGAVGGAGVVEPLERPASLALELGGIVDEVLVEEGARVAAGDVLLTLRSTSARAELAEAEAEVRAARADAVAAAADAAAASSRAESSMDVAARTRVLAERGVATPDERDRVGYTEEAEREQAQAASARVTQAGARARAAEARREAAAARLAAMTLRAPADGEVLQLLVLPGEHVSPGGAAVVLGDTSVVRVRLDIDERDAVRVEEGAPARVRIEGLPGEVAGRVVQVGRRVGRKNVRTDDPTDRTDARFVEVVVELDAAPSVPVGIRVEGFVTGRDPG
jgi:HlyD family secretion protein